MKQPGSDATLPTGLDDVLLPVGDYTVHASYYGPGERSALLLHGGGNSSSGQIFPLREDLAERGIGTVSLDHLGHGETGGNIELASLERRVIEAKMVLEHFQPSHFLGSVSMSMGGHVAIKLHELLDFPAMVLIAPAVYSRHAYTAPFGGEFTDIIRAERSFEDSDVWDILGAYRGALTVIAGAEDKVIPKEVIQKCYDHAVHAKRQLVLLDRIDHFVMTRLRAGPDKQLKTVLDKITDSLLAKGYWS